MAKPQPTATAADSTPSTSPMACAKAVERKRKFGTFHGNPARRVEQPIAQDGSPGYATNQPAEPASAGGTNRSSVSPSGAKHSYVDLNACTPVELSPHVKLRKMHGCYRLPFVD